MEKQKVKVTATHSAHPNTGGVFELGEHKRNATFFPKGRTVELEVTTEDEVLFEHDTDDTGNVVIDQVTNKPRMRPALDENGEQKYRKLSQLSKLKRNPFLRIEIPKTADELEAEAKALREQEANRGGAHDRALGGTPAPVQSEIQAAEAKKRQDQEKEEQAEAVKRTPIRVDESDEQKGRHKR